MGTAALARSSTWAPSGIGSLEEAAERAIRSARNELVTAGPGAGKTELLGQRANFLLQTGACTYPRRILAISFKRSSAKNLLERVRLRCGRDEAQRFASSTFDSFAKRLFDRHWRALPEPWKLRGGYRIGNELGDRAFGDFQRQALEELDLPGKWPKWLVDQGGFRPPSLMSVRREQFSGVVHGTSLSTKPTNDAEFLYFLHVMKSLHSGSAELTFPTIARLVELLIRINKPLREALLATYSHVFVDEFQDTTGAQYALLRTCFHSSSAVLTCVGDSKQRVMAWAGAKRDAFEQYGQDFLANGPGLELTRNYRSNARIVEILNVLKSHIAPNEAHLVPVRAAPTLPANEVCSVVISADEVMENECVARYVGRQIESGVPVREVALLVRQQARQWRERLEPAFGQRGLKIRNEDEDVYGGVRIQDLMTEPASDALLNAVELLTTARGGATWLRTLELLYEADGLGPDEEFAQTASVRRELEEFCREHRIDRGNPPDAERLSELLNHARVLFSNSRLRRLGAQYLQGEFLETVIEATRRFLLQATDASDSWPAVFRHYRGTEQVPLLTITRSKGFEYSIVLILGMDAQQWWSFGKDPVEGHANFFVAASRARDLLFLLLCKGKRFDSIREIFTRLKEAKVGLRPAREWAEQSALLGAVHTGPTAAAR